MKRFQTGHYGGNKWGGKYLRAPDIFYTILEKGKGKLVKLGKVAKVTRGFTTGANEFFYLPSKYFDIRADGDYYRLIPKQGGLPENIRIEKEFLKPVIKSPRECKSILIKPEELKHKIFFCNKPKEDLEGIGALKYIEWGEKLEIEIKSGGDMGKKVSGYHKLETVKNRKVWYDLGVKNLPSAVWIKSINDNHGQSIVKGGCLVDQRLYGIYFLKETEPEIQAILLNNSIFYLFKELEGRVNLGEGVLDTAVFEAKKSKVIVATLVKRNGLDIEKIKFKSIFEECGIDPNKPIREQKPNPLPDRAELDNIVFDELGLTEEERKEVYWSVCELVKQRLEKARSLRK